MNESVVALDRGMGRELRRVASGAPAPQRPATPLPRFLQVEPVGQCNLRCRMCPIELRPESEDHHRPATIALDVFRGLLDQFPTVQTLQLQGLGEPMMHPRFFDMVEMAVARGMTVSTNTNLTLLTERRAERCVTSGLAQIHVSIDGATAATYEHIRVRASFAKVMRNLDRLMAARARLASRTPEVRWVMVVMRRNLDELAAVVHLAARHGVEQVHVQHLCHDFGESSLPARYAGMRSFVDAETLLAEDPARVDAAFAQARAAAATLGVDLRLPDIRRPDDPAVAEPPPASGRSRCDWPWSGAYVSWDGRAMPCCMVSTPDRIHFGNMAREGVGAIWNSAVFEDFRDRLDSPAPPEICTSCAIYNRTF